MSKSKTNMFQFEALNRMDWNAKRFYPIRSKIPPAQSSKLEELESPSWSQTQASLNSENMMGFQTLPKNDDSSNVLVSCLYLTKHGKYLKQITPIVGTLWVLLPFKNNSYFIWNFILGTTTETEIRKRRSSSYHVSMDLWKILRQGKEQWVWLVFWPTPWKVCQKSYSTITWWCFGYGDKNFHKF